VRLPRPELASGWILGHCPGPATTVREDVVEASPVAGIDVGGDKKGYHLIILQAAKVVRSMRTTSPQAMLEECLKLGVRAVGIDAPCQWAFEGNGRFAERELARRRIFCFATPTRARADENLTGFYRWMVKGEEVYLTFSSAYPLLTSREYDGGRVCFETFPHAITCALRGRDATSAKEKGRQRRGALKAAGVDITDLRSIDDIDAALCALTAGYVLQGQSQAYGDVRGGFIRVPLSAEVRAW
jgi:predicted nuclease with RNAse H fold